jgi:hypothetical protein
MQSIIELVATILISGGLVIASQFLRRSDREQHDE